MCMRLHELDPRWLCMRDFPLRRGVARPSASASATSARPCARASLRSAEKRSSSHDGAAFDNIGTGPRQASGSGEQQRRACCLFPFFSSYGKITALVALALLFFITQHVMLTQLRAEDLRAPSGADVFLHTGPLKEHHIVEVNPKRAYPSAAHHREIEPQRRPANPILPPSGQPRYNAPQGDRIHSELQNVPLPSISGLSSEKQSFEYTPLNSQLLDGEARGGVSEATLCILMPVRSNNLANAVRNVESWASTHARGRSIPCVPRMTSEDVRVGDPPAISQRQVPRAGGSDGGAPRPDLAFFHAQSFVAEEDVRLAERLHAILTMPAFGNGMSLRHCFGAVRYLAARIPPKLDVYTIYPTHNFTGPNMHFLSALDALKQLVEDRLARYTHFQLMESDTYPLQPNWAMRLVKLATAADEGPGRRQRGRQQGGDTEDVGREHESVPSLEGARAQEGVGAGRRGASRARVWVQGSLSACLKPTETEHVNGNALYALDGAFITALRKEMRLRLDSWAFDVLIGHWLRTSHPRRIRSSPHVLSISTFQRNRTCCEFVRSLVQALQPPSDASDNASLVSSASSLTPSNTLSHSPFRTPVGAFSGLEHHAVDHGSLLASSASSLNGTHDTAALSATHAEQLFDTYPDLLLLHTGNIGKLPDAHVPPSMRALGLSLQDLFVRRSDAPCAAVSLPLQRCARAQPWRARIKAQGDCRLPPLPPLPLFWVPVLDEGTAAPAVEAAAGWISATFNVVCSVVPPRGSASNDPIFSNMWRYIRGNVGAKTGARSAADVGIRIDGEEDKVARGLNDGDFAHAVTDGQIGEPEGVYTGGEVGGRIGWRTGGRTGGRSGENQGRSAGSWGAVSECLVGSSVRALLEALPDGREGQLLAFLEEPLSMLMHAFEASDARTGGQHEGARVPASADTDAATTLATATAAGATTDAAPTADSAVAARLRAWLDSVPDNPLVRQLSACGETPPPLFKGSSTDNSDGNGGDNGGNKGKNSVDDSSIGSNDGSRVLSSHLETAKQAMQEKLLVGTQGAEASRRAVHAAATYFGWTAVADMNTAAATSPPLFAYSAPPVSSSALPMSLLPLLRQKVAHDMRLYEYAARLAADQFRSVVWEEGNVTDVCAAAEAAGAAATSPPPSPMAVGETLSFTFDGDGVRTYELKLLLPADGVQLLLRAKNLIGTSDISINVLISHRGPQPSFAEHAFRYLYESRPPHKRAGKFMLHADRLRACCVEAAEMAGESNASLVCARRAFSLWIAFKYRAVAIAQLDFVVRLTRTGAKRASSAETPSTGIT